jgi:hypothetical protein
MQDKPKATRKRTGQVSGVQVMFAAILSIGLILTINFSARIAAGQPLQEAHRRVSGEIEALQAEHARLTAQRDYVLSDTYVEQWARADGKMVREGEVLIVPVPSGVGAEATPEAQFDLSALQTAPQETPPWVLWWQIFFDSPPPNLPSAGGS